MRALLVVNPRARAAAPRHVAVAERVLGSGFDIDKVLTKRRGHATEIAASSTADVVIVVGGDGAVNEVANGLAGGDRPMGIIPSGGANVFARSLGIPEDPIEAAEHLLRVRDREPRRVPLGRAGDRFFTFSCGMGLDGAIVGAVERRQRWKKAGQQAYYAWAALSTFFLRTDRRHPLIRVRWGERLEHSREGLFLAICQQTSPYTFLGGRPMNVSPQADLYLGLDMLGLYSLRLTLVLRTVLSSFGSGRHIRGRKALYLHDETRIELTSSRPLPVQMDGEYVGDRDRLSLEAVPDALAFLG